MDHSDTVFAIYQKALHLPPKEQRSYVSQACRPFPELEEKVLEVLELAQGDPTQVRDLIENLFDIQPPPVVQPEFIDQFKILSEIGHGGMGIVYLAEQTAPKRQVAIKVMREGFASRNFQQRFQRECQALSLLNHDYIANIFQGGTSTEGQPYFAMALVKGLPVTDYCEKHGLGLLEKLILFIKICEGVHHAHARGVLHRDLKPSNVLIENRDGQPIPKIIDFGIAKLADAANPQDLFQTRDQDMRFPLGTLAYLSPEQTGRNLGDVDFRSDIYALGLLLYELVTGEYPFDKVSMSQMSWEQLFELINHKIPETPSRYLGRLHSQKRYAKDLKETKQTGRVISDLDAIIFKALAKEKQKRYASVQDFAQDVSAFLDKKPVRAYSVTAWRRWSLWFKRNRALGIASGLFILALILGLTSTTWVLLLEKKEKEKVQATLLILEELLESPDPYKYDVNVKLKDLLGEFSEKLKKEHSVIPDVKARLHQTLGNTYANLGLYQASGNEYQASKGILLKNLNPASRELLDLEIKILATKSAMGQHREVRDQTKDLFRKVLNKFGGKDDLTLDAQLHWALLLNDLGKPQDAVEELEDVLQKRVSLHGREHDKSLLDLEHLVRTYILLGKWDLAESHQRQLLDSLERIYGPDHPRTLLSSRTFSRILVFQEKYEQAEALISATLEKHKLVLGDQHRETIKMMSSLTHLFFKQGKLKQAEPLVEEAYQKMRVLNGDDHGSTLTMLNNLAITRLKLGKIAQSKKDLDTLLKKSEAIFSPGHQQLILFKSSLVAYYQTTNKNEKSLKLSRQIFEECLNNLGEKNPRTVHTAYYYGHALMVQGHYRQAKDFLQNFLDVAETVGNRDVTRGIKNDLREVLQKLGEPIPSRLLEE